MTDELEPRKRPGPMEDLKSGKIIYAVIPMRIDPIVGEEWLVMFQHPLQVLAEDPDLTLHHHRVFAYMLSQMDGKNFIRISQSDIAKNLNIQRPHISAAIKLLVEKEIFIKGPKVGTSWTYVLNANYGYKGRLRDVPKERKRHLTLIEENKILEEIERE
jgi:DNA-binding MarR family transcriptional regulator